MNNLIYNSKLILPLLGGILYTFAFPTKMGFYIFPGQIFGLILLFLSFKNRSSVNGTLKKDLIFNILMVLLFSLGHYQSGYYWIPDTIYAFGNIEPPLNYAVGVLLALIITPHLTIFAIIKTTINHKLPKLPLSIISWAFILTLLEYFTPQQFPGHAGHPWMHLAPHLGLAPIFSYSIYSFISISIALVITKLIKSRKLDKTSLTVSLLLIIINFLVPLPQDRKLKQNKKINNIRLVQANIGNFMKVSSEAGDPLSLKNIYSKYYDLSTEDNSTTKPGQMIDLIIWPETALPEFITTSLAKTDSKFVPPLLKKVIDKSGSEIFTGGYEEALPNSYASFKSQYNSAFLISDQSILKEAYNKMKLLPFGEGLPFGPFNEYLSKVITNISYFASGTKYPIFLTRNDTPFFSLICYEVLFPSFVRDYLSKLNSNPHFMINLTNDSWYGDSSEPYQHLFLAKWRAVEFNLPIIRMTNTGISSIIYPNGKESIRMLHGETRAIDITLKTYNRTPTLYQQFGIMNIILLGLILILLEFIILNYFLRVKIKSFF